MSATKHNLIRDLLVVAVLTSAFFGVFSVLTMLLSSQHAFIGPPPPGPGPGPGPMLGKRPQMNLSISILVTTGMMLVLWLINILLYAWMQRGRAREQAKNIMRYVISYAVIFAVISLYHLALGQIRFSLDPSYGRALFFPIIAGLTNNTIVIVLLDLVVLQRKKSQVELENTQLKMNSIQAQHQHLKHQLQPHFLFNALNTLKTLIKRQPLEAEQYLVRLSEFLRASITADSQNTVALREELKLCTDYLEMQKVRFKDAFSYTVEVPEALLDEAYVPIFSLQLLAENAIKHNGLTVEEPLRIEITCPGGDHLTVRNTRKPKAIHEPTSGIGLRNLAERYQVLAGKEITITATEEHFTVELPILSK